ncbi:protein FAM168A isoform X2 [Hippoglossus stenolepis]|uniref:protein FAM168A isoform X2 n=1 Tax=Hippoglossus stenolepis TaxID=195615 RepID=UPI00159CB691|nr:protein FAM168A isoform X2 [Hippoglossus stenolepis]
MASGHPTDKFSFMYQPDTHKSKNRLASAMNPVYSPVQPGTPYGNPKNMAFTGYPGGYPAAAPHYTPNLYQTGSPGYPPGYTAAGTPYKVPPTQSNGAPPPYTPTPTPYPTAMYPIRSAYPQQNLYAQGAYYTQPVYAAQPHVIHHTTVVQPNSIPSTALYPADNAPAPPDWRTPSYCANLQAPRDTWVQLRTTSLVEPTNHVWSPPSYATAQILHGLPLVTTGTPHLSARTKLKCNSHFTFIFIVIMRHSLNILTKAAFIF